MSVLLIMALVPSSLSLASQNVIHYDRPAVTLEGTLDLQTFPGPPNYESIANGDEIERHFYLKLDMPVSVVPAIDVSQKDRDEPELNVRIIQLSIDSEDDLLWKRFRARGKGARARLSGTLFHRFTGHHHSRVLMSVDRLDVTEK